MQKKGPLLIYHNYYAKGFADEGGGFIPEVRERGKQAPEL